MGKRPAPGKIIYTTYNNKNKQMLQSLSDDTCNNKKDKKIIAVKIKII